MHETEDWPRFRWDAGNLLAPLAAVRYQQGRLTGQMQDLGFNLQQEAVLQTLTSSQKR